MENSNKIAFRAVDLISRFALHFAGAMILFWLIDVLFFGEPFGFKSFIFRDRFDIFFALLFASAFTFIDWLVQLRRMKRTV